MIRNTRAAATDESMIMIYRFIFLIFVVFIILGISGIAYSYEVDLKDTDSMLFLRETMDCLAPEGVIDFDSFQDLDLFNYCHFNDDAEDNFFVYLVAGYNEDFEQEFRYGNSDLEWVFDIYSSGLASDNIRAYKPGYFYWQFPVKFSKGGEIIDSNLVIAVVEKNDE